MDENAVRKLEKHSERAILDGISDMRIKQLPLLPPQLTMHLMAKATVAVYEAAVGNDDRGRPSDGSVES